MIQVNTLKAAGISEQEIRQLETALEALQTAKNQACHQAPHIVCTGIYNAGKSTLLNSLAGKEIFPTGDIPTTKKSAQAEFSGAVYIDTPGLNAMEDDDRETQAAYETADFILFVANAQNGGVSAAEAMWLQKLKERYGSLQQRLIFALTHSAQVDPEQLPGIRDKVCGNLSKAVGFAPEKILCVDSIAYQDGVADNELLLIENSGIPQLQAYLSECVAAARETLQKAQKADVTKRRQDAIKQIDYCKGNCLQMMQKQSSERQIVGIQDIFAKTENALTNTISGFATLYGGMSFLKGGESFEGTDRSSLKSSARSHVRDFASEVLSDAKDAARRIAERAQADYGNTGLNSAYFKKCSEVNSILEKLHIELVQQGVRINAPQEIQLHPNVSRLDSDLSQFTDDSSYWSASEYFNIFENRIEVNKYDYGYEERGLFGSTKWVPQYAIYTHNATYEINQKIDQTFKRKIERAQQQIDRFYWQPFLKDLRKEADKCMAKLRAAAEAVSAASQEAEKPYQAALKYLDNLRKEVAR